MRIICTGDLHIGRRSSQISNAAVRLSCSTAWKHIVRYAIQHRTELILITGDFIDCENKRFEALGPIRKGLEELEKNGITVICVGGNHDHDVLPALVQRFNLPNFIVLGKNGVWENMCFQGDDSTILSIDGWSFPRNRYKTSPLTTYSGLPLATRSTLPITTYSAAQPPVNTSDHPISTGHTKDVATFSIGIMHADYNVPASHYGPISHVELESSPIDLWLLGHIHLPRVINLTSNRKVIYPGSPQAMDPGPGERGAHGFYDIEIKGNQIRAVDFVPTSSVRYEHISIDVTGCETALDIETVVSNEITTAAREFIRESNSYESVLSHISLSIDLTGRCSKKIGSEGIPLSDCIRNIKDAGLEVDDIPISIHRIIDRTLSQYSQEQIAQIAAGVGAAAAIAQLIQKMENDPDDTIPDCLRPMVRSSLMELNRPKAYRESGVTLQQWDDAAIKSVLIKQSYSLLDSVLNGHSLVGGQ